MVCTLAFGSASAAADPAWVKRSLALQYELGSDVGFRNAPWIGTHNSYNSQAEMGPTLSAQDSNQQIPIVDQLDEGMRSIEIDVHWFAKAEEGGRAPVVCHARPASEGHAGCTVEKPLGPVLDDVAAWLRANPDEVVMLYLESHLENTEGHDRAADVVEQKLGDLLFRPPASEAAGQCSELPLRLSRDRIRAASAQVFIVSNCGPSQRWGSVVFTWERHEESRPFGFQDFPYCGPDYSREDYERKLIRYYEDATQLTQHAGTPDDGIDINTAAAMSRCGVDLVHLDMLDHDDPRLLGLVWSWAPGEPSGGRCSVQRVGRSIPDGRWKSRRCPGRRHAACRSKDGRWAITPEPIRFRDARDTCRSKRKARFAVPRTGYEEQLLRLAMERNDIRGVWLGQERERGGRWVPRDRR